MINDILIDDGTFVFNSLTECDILVFNPPLKVEWTAWKNEHPGGPQTTVCVDFDFGMSYEFRPYCSISLGWTYNDIKMDTPLPEIVKSFVQYDLFHAFCHTSLDPNYSHLHWALYGNLKDRVKVIESSLD